MTHYRDRLNAGEFSAPKVTTTTDAAGVPLDSKTGKITERITPAPATPKKTKRKRSSRA